MATQGVSVTAAKAQAAMRAGFVVALGLGVWRMAGGPASVAWLALHGLAGVITLAGAVALAWYWRTALLWAATGLMVLGALWALAISGGGHGLATVHWLAMLVAVALAEMGAGKAKTAIR